MNTLTKFYLSLKVQLNVIVTNIDISKVVYWKKTVILDCYIKEDIIAG